MIEIRVEVRGTNPAELTAEALRHAKAFFGDVPSDAFEVDLGTVEPAAWSLGYVVETWGADATVRLKGACTC